MLTSVLVLLAMVGLTCLGTLGVLGCWVGYHFAVNGSLPVGSKDHHSRLLQAKLEMTEELASEMQQARNYHRDRADKMYELVLELALAKQD